MIEKREYPAVDLARFFCAILVVTIHLAPFEAGTLNGWANFWLQQWIARVAVPFFFVASGYFLFAKMGHGPYRGDVVRRYIKRMVVTYLIWSAIYLPFSVELMKALVAGSDTPWWVMYLRRFVFMGSYTQLWYCTGIVVAVAVVALLLRVGLRPGAVVAIGAAFYLVAVITNGWYGALQRLQPLAPWALQAADWVYSWVMTTRDGLFFGFLPVAVGMWLAKKEVTIDSRRATAGLVLALGALGAETYFVRQKGIVRDFDVLFFTAVAGAALFVFCLSAKIKPRPIYGVLRKLSALVFFAHLWVYQFASKVLQHMGLAWQSNTQIYLTTLASALLAGLGVIWLGRFKYFKWLRWLY